MSSAAVVISALRVKSQISSKANIAKYYMFGQIALSKQCRSISDCPIPDHITIIAPLVGRAMVLGNF